jgi:integrase
MPPTRQHRLTPERRRHAKLTPRFLVRRGSRYYFSPPRYLRDLGVQLERLPDDPIEARRVCEALAERADAVRSQAKRASRVAKGTPPTPANLNPHTPGTVAWLIRRWAGDIDDRNTPGASPEWRRLSERTRLDYRRHLMTLRDLFGKHRLSGITPRVVHAYAAKLSDSATGLIPRQNRYRLQVLQALLAYGVRVGALESNSATKLRLPANPPRRAYWTDADVARFLAADPPPSIRLALMLGRNTGQRQADVLVLRWSDISDGWITLEQRKSRRAGRAGKRVAIPISRELQSELDRAPRGGAYVVTSEATGRPYRPDHFRHEWREVTKRAGLDGLTFLDLRRSAVVCLAEAGADVGQIAAWTGHAVSDTAAILNTYFVATRAAAKAALDKLEAHRTVGQNVERADVERAGAEA